MGRPVRLAGQTIGDARVTHSKRTPLYDFHLAHGAKMVPFAGYDMPVQYAPGVMKEHLHTRAHAGLFDVSHMGQVRVSAASYDDAALAMEALVPVDVLGLKPGRQRYAMFTNPDGGIEDDLMLANRGDHLFVVVNAACKTADIAHMKNNLAGCDVEEMTDRALLALQGPGAEAALAKLAPAVADMAFMDVRDVEILGADCIVSRSGYSGEDGYEVSVPNASATALAEALVAMDEVAPIGLGARDSLRLEAGLCLYGNDIDSTTSPIEGNLAWAIQKSRRTGGARAGGFPGAEAILGQLDGGVPRLRVGLRPEGRAPMRAHTPLFATEDSSDPIGEITSGGFGPTIGGPIAMGYVSTDLARTGTGIFAELRGKRLPVDVADLPFTTPNYKRR